jgi:hypothetical protein
MGSRLGIIAWELKSLGTLKRLFFLWKKVVYKELIGRTAKLEFKLVD